MQDLARRVAPEQCAVDADAVVAWIVVESGAPAQWPDPGRVVRVPLG
ncbi:hypothetical protein [Pseudonocardia acidicola]|uniref:Uncharacterized protein n=1 Tax=Pseudonocardia acidicola TaxID=2724939 RepID=A0ABX1S2T9_9PSEU|nr:hypothetical protein [Pseudonocardia acidicola]NMH95871.1 hypothetical protein [Pseudonocardia acidicola]